MQKHIVLLTGLLGGFIGALIIFCVGLWLLTHRPLLLINMFGNPQAVNRMSSTTPESAVKNIFTNQIYTEESRVIEAVKQSNGAVVSIVISKNVPVLEQYYSRNQNVDPNDPFSKLFNMPIPQIRQNGTRLQQVGAGSGFLVSSDGMIVTNRHVVADKTAEYTVFLNDGSKHVAKVTARDSVNDLAILKISGIALPYLTFANSDSVQVGQTAIAIGNSLGEFRNTVSVGVVSGLSRSLTAGTTGGMSEQLDNVIQTDAAINPGNSGGPLLNLDGEVIGVSVAVAQGSQSIGFAIPGNVAKSVASSVQRAGRIVRPYLGIRYTLITPELKDSNKLSVDYGVLIIRGSSKDELAVIPGSPADKAGLVENDIILEADGKKLTRESSLASFIRNHKVGDSIKLSVLSRGKTRSVALQLEATPTIQ